MTEIIEETQQEEKISRGIGVSVAIHAVILAFFTIKTAFFDPEPIDFTQAIRIDMVGLPDKVKQKEPTAPPKEAKPALPEKKTEEVVKVAEKERSVEKPKPVVKKEPDAVKLDDSKVKQKNALEKLKAMAALEKIKQDVDQEKKPAPEPEQKFKGNQISPGTDLSGLSKLQHDTYVSDLNKHIKKHWDLPEWLSKRDLKAQVRVYIDRSGLVISRKIVKSSGNPEYDDAVLATIDRAVPFPQPPDRFLSLVETDGILIGFPE